MWRTGEPAHIRTAHDGSERPIREVTETGRAAFQLTELPAWMCFPLDSVRDDARPLGALYLERRAGAFDAHQVAIAERVSSQAARAIALSETELARRALLDACADGLWLVDPRTAEIVEFNATAPRLLGYTHDEFHRMPLSLINPLTDESGIRAGMRNIQQHGEYAFDSQHRRRNGELLDVQVTARAIDFAGQPMFACTVRDVTEPKRAEARVQQAQKLEVIGRLAGGIAHDFNNLLTGIIGNAAFLLDGNPKPEDRAGPAAEREAIAEIYESGERAAALTRRLLAFSRRHDTKLQAVDLNECVQDTLGMLTRLIGADITLSTQLEAQDATVLVDRIQLEQALLNLVINARDALPSGGGIVLATRNASVRERGRLRPAPGWSGSVVTLSVRDDGCGMSDGVQTRMFEPFFTTKPAERGTGLGLATVQTFVERSGGMIDVRSAPGVGTEIEIAFPHVPAAGAIPSELDFSPTERLSGDEVILVVEDDPWIRAMVRRTLLAYGYHLLIAASAREAGPLLHDAGRTIDLLVTDVVMPQSDGVALAKLARSLRPEIRVLLMTGYGYTDDTATVRGDARRASEPWIRKPFTGAVLAARIREVLDARREAREEA